MSGAGGAIRHHPSEATLVGHAARALGPAAGLVVAAHLARCPACRAKVGLAEAVGGALLETLPPTPLAPDALARLMARLEAHPEEGAAPGPPADSPAAELRRLLQAARPHWVAPGLRHALLLREQGSDGTLRLLRVRPGTALPRHAHRGVELTLVLEGRFADEAGQYGPGDLAEVDEGAPHRPVAGGSADCVCLLATHGRLHFEGVPGRILGWLGRV